MKKILLSTFAMLFILSITINAQENLLPNYQFDDGATGWLLGNWGAEATFEIDDFGLLSGDNSGKFELVTLGENIWEARVYVDGIPVDENEIYYLSFMATVEEEVELSFAWELNADPYTKFWEETITLHPDSLTYKRTIIPTGTLEDPRFNIMMGAETNLNRVFYLDSMVLSTDPFVYGEPSVGIEGKTVANDFQIYPNPAEEYFTVELNNIRDQKINVDLYNITGQKVRTLVEGYAMTGEFNQRFSTRDLNAGAYYIRVTGDKNKFNRMLIVK